MTAGSRKHAEFWEGREAQPEPITINPITALVAILIVVTLLFFIVGAVKDAPKASAHHTGTSTQVASSTMLRLGSSGEDVKAVQQKLNSYGYSLAVDGQYGPVTTKVVRHWQNANGLTVDGITGPQTLASLGLTGGATGTSQAERGEQSQQTPAEAPPVEVIPAGQYPSQDAPPSSAATGPTGPHYGSAISGRCTQWEPMLEYFSPGWNIEQFSKIMYRESRCTPGVTSPTNCCRGLLQIHQLHIPNLGVCGVYSKSDLYQADKNVCSAAVVYRRAGGTSPWRMTR